MSIVRTGFPTSRLTVEDSDEVLFPYYAKMDMRTTLPSSLTEAIDLYLYNRGLVALKCPVKKARIKPWVKGKCYSEIEKEVIGILAKSSMSQEFSKKIMVVVIDNTPGGYMFRHGDNDQLHSYVDTCILYYHHLLHPTIATYKRDEDTRYV